MWGDNRYVNDLRILIAIELYVDPGFYSLNPIFTFSLNNKLGAFNGIDTILAISVSHNALDTNKTKGEFVQRKALNICSAYRWIGNAYWSVYLPFHHAACKASKCGVFSGPYFPAFGLEKTLFMQCSFFEYSSVVLQKLWVIIEVYV